jgi:hypothetical protein
MATNGDIMSGPTCLPMDGTVSELGNKKADTFINL